MQTRKFLYLLAAIVAVGFISYAAAAPSNSSPAQPFRYGILGKISELGITQDQKTQIHAILREAQPSFQPLVKQYVQERRAFAAIHAAPVNDDAIRAQAGRVAPVEADLTLKRAHLAERIGAIITPEQTRRLKEIAAEVDSRVDAMIESIGNRIAGQ